MLRGEQDDFWVKLKDIRGLWGDPWCIRGNLNIIRYPRKRMDYFKLSLTMQRFSKIIEELNFHWLSLELRGIYLVWRFKQPIHVLLGSLPSTWRVGESFFWASIVCLIKVSFLSFTYFVRWGWNKERTLKFTNMWIKVDDLKDLIKS